MLVLISFVLVLVATGLLVVGLLQDGLALIYISIACSIAAGVILAVAVKVARPKAASAGGATPLPDDQQAPRPVEDQGPVVPVATVAAQAPAATVAAPVAAATQTSAPVSQDPVTAAVPVVTLTSADVDEADEDEEDLESTATYAEGDEDFFPIADYDDLRANEILPLLPELYADELEVVAEREQSTKARKAILSRIDQLRATAPSGEEAVEVNGVEAEAAPAVIEEEWAAADEGWDEATDEEDDDDDEDFFPIADYDELRVAEIMPLIPQLEPEELVEVREREVAGANRKMIVSSIDRRIGADQAPSRPARRAPANGTVAPPAAPTRKAAPKKAVSARAAAAKATTGKAAAKTAAAKTSAAKTTAKKAPAKKAPARRS